MFDARAITARSQHNVEFSLAGESGRTYTISTQEVTGYQPDLTKTILEIDLMTFSEPTWSRATADLVLRHGRTWLLKADTWVIGTCHCLRSWERPSEVVLFSMAIRPGWRGRGLGTRFFQGVLDDLKRTGIRAVTLEVESHRRAAVHVYETRFGFEVVGPREVPTVQRNRYAPPDKLEMRLELADGNLAEVTEFPPR
ncbi:MAG: GNAT family N-acetyltransferase [Alphaproteobacteria bacterium]|nr:GNAT family N-acetyltransferase [Alphaproteobacteria bacterium]